MSVAEPPGRRAEHLDGLAAEPELLVKLAKDRLFGGFAVVDAPLGKLPSVPPPDPPRPHDWRRRLETTMPNAWPVAVWIDQGSRLSEGELLFQRPGPA